jgi:catechol 2,3-dioxygenase-like lactoylglutathione lyase family enzyme
MSTDVAEHRAGVNTALKPITRVGELQRAGYVALKSPDPEAAAKFATEHLGLSLVHVDSDGRHYLAAHGLDPYSLIYLPGPAGLDHMSFVVDDVAAGNREERRLRAAGAEVERIDESPLWRTGPALRLTSPTGNVLHVTPGVRVERTMAARTVPPQVSPAPISMDHIGFCTLDLEAEIKFATDVLGLQVSARITDPDGNLFVAFVRSHTLFHCFVVVSSTRNDLHHFQFTLKNAPAVHAACESFHAGGEVDVLWGPVRHGPGNNIAVYFYDHDRHFIEYSAEEEIILDDAAYLVQQWDTENPKTLDEWGSTAPAALFE